MKWFKHYTNASRSEKLNALRDKYGLEGYARYWLLVELLAEKFDGSNTTFRIHKRTMSQQLGYYRHTMSEQWLNNGQTLGLYKFHCDGDVFVIVFDKLLEIKDNHTKNLQVKNKSLAPRKDKEKNKNKNKNKICKNFHFDLDAIYEKYPRKVGKKRGMQKLQSIIKSQEDYDNVMQGVERYSKYCNDSKTEAKYIKQFNTWVNGEHWNDDIKQVRTERDIDLEILKMCGVDASEAFPEYREN